MRRLRGGPGHRTRGGEGRRRRSRAKRQYVRWTSAKISRELLREQKRGEGGGRKGGGGDKTAGTHRVECGAAVAADEILNLLVRNLE